MPSYDEIRDAQRQGWNQTAAMWKKWQADLLPWQEQVGSVLLERARLRDGARVLDVATGLGEPGITAASRVGSGSVIGTDLSEEMVGYAAGNARDRGVTNFTTRVADAGALPFADGSFDVVLCQFGLMLFPDPATAAREIARVLAPGGRVALCAWAQPEVNPWVSAMLARFNAILSLPSPAPDAPSMFRLSEPGSLRRLLENAGLREVVEEPAELVATYRSGEQYWRMMREISGGIARALAAATDAQRAEVERVALEVFGGNAPYTARGRAWVASATR